MFLIPGPLKVALYNIMMDKHQTEEDWKNTELEYDRAAESSWGQVDISPAVDGLEGLEVKLLACQKVIGWETTRKLCQNGVQV